MMSYDLTCVTPPFHMQPKSMGELCRIKTSTRVPSSIALKCPLIIALCVVKKRASRRYVFVIISHGGVRSNEINFEEFL